jgi:hypothetical protein
MERSPYGEDWKVGAAGGGVFGWLQADTVAAVWIAAAAIHREKNTVEVAAAAGLQPQQAAANKLGYGYGRFNQGRGRKRLLCRR